MTLPRTSAGSPRTGTTFGQAVKLSSLGCAWTRRRCAGAAAPDGLATVVVRSGFAEAPDQARFLPVTSSSDTVKRAMSRRTPGRNSWADEPRQFAEFEISAGPFPENVDQLTFPTIQTYSDSEVVRWVQPVEAGSPEPDRPAPVLVLTTAGDAVSAVDVTSDAQPASAEPTNCLLAFSAESPSLSRPLPCSPRYAPADAGRDRPAACSVGLTGFDPRMVPVQPTSHAGLQPEPSAPPPTRQTRAPTPVGALV